MAWAHDVEVDGIYYNLDQKDNTASVTGYNKNEHTGSLVIPESISIEETIYKVTSLGESCFSSCKDLTSITIPTP